MFLRYEVVVADCLHNLKYFDDCEFFVGCPILFEEKGGQVGPVVDDAAAESTENRPDPELALETTGLLF